VSLMLFMIIERFKNCDPKPIYQHLRDKGRGLPAGLKYIDSWIEPNFDRCFQIMECDDSVAGMGAALARIRRVRDRARRAIKANAGACREQARRAGVTTWSM